MTTTRELYCQYLLSSQINYTCTHLADHFADLSHDDVHRYLKEEKLTPRLLWKKVNSLFTSRLEGYVIFDVPPPILGTFAESYINPHLIISPILSASYVARQGKLQQGF